MNLVTVHGFDGSSSMNVNRDKSRRVQFETTTRKSQVSRIWQIEDCILPICSSLFFCRALFVFCFFLCVVRMARMHVFLRRDPWGASVIAQPLRVTELKSVFLLL